MIIARAPLRITLGGGGTDIPAYYKHSGRQRGGLCLAAAIDRYVYVTVNRTFVSDLIVKYSKMERVKHAGELEHPIVREAMRLCDLDGGGMEITSMADIHAGTGLGGSGSFTVALLKALHAWKKEWRTPQEIAEEACYIEIDRLQEPIGKQDQYIAAFGGVTQFAFHARPLTDGRDVTVSPIPSQEGLQDSLVMVFTGHSRSASDVLRQRGARLAAREPQVFEELDAASKSAGDARDALLRGDIRELGAIWDAHWKKKRAAVGMSNPEIDALYELGMQNGAYGGKLVGAGGGGFLLFVAEDKRQLRAAMQAGNWQEVRVNLDYEGVKLITV